MSPQLEERHNLLKNIYRFWVKTYDLLFLIRGDLKEMEKRESNNELRRSDIKHTKKVEEIFLKTIKEDELRVIEIWNNSTIDEAAHQILKHLSEYKSLPES
jgi:thymidylate kinase